LGHPKGVSHKSDRRILDVLLNAGDRVSWGEIVRRTGLDERTVSRRLTILKNVGTVVRIREPRHGNYVSYLLPWKETERAYYYAHGRHSEIYSQMEANFTRFLSMLGPVERTTSSTGKVKLVLQLPIRRLADLTHRLEPFVAGHEWANSRPYSEVVKKGIVWLDGMLCEDCIDRLGRFPRPKLADPIAGHYTCPECGREYDELEPPTS